MSSYSIYRAFVSFVTYMEHYRDIDHYKRGATVIRNGLPDIDKSKQGWRNIMEIKNFCEMLLTEEESIVELVAQDDGAATIEALTEEAKQTYLLNPEEFEKVILEK